MKYTRMPIEKESPEEMGYNNIKYNLAESSVSDFVLKDMQLDISALTLCYTDHKGNPLLRELIADAYIKNAKDDVLLTAGAAAALFIIASSLLEKEDHLIVVRPNYATNIETPKAIGCSIAYIDLTFEGHWQLDVEAVEREIMSNTKYISVTNPHNPTGALLNENDLMKLIAIAERHQIYLLVDETYRELNFNEPAPYAACLSSRVISVSSVSKAFGLPGLRIGWLITQDKNLMELFLAAKEQIFITNSVLDEEVAYQFLVKKQAYFPAIKEQIKTKFSILEKWIAEEQRLEWVRPGGGVVCFPRIKPKYDIATKALYDLLMQKYSTMVGPGHWFNMPGNYMRIGYGWPTPAELETGLANVSRALEELNVK